MRRNMLRLAGIVMSAAFVVTPAQAQAPSAPWPARPLKLVVPFPPGGATDIVGRLVAERLQQALGQPVVVDNRAGASGNIGVGEVARAPADGYTLVLGAPQTLTINPQLLANKPFDPQKDLAPVVLVATMPNVLIVSPRRPMRTAQELAAHAKAHPDQLTYGSSSIGGTPHLSAEMFKSMAGVQILHVPYKGSAPALQDLIGGQIDLMFDNLPAALPHIRSGAVRALAVTSLRRSVSAPELPTLDESGLKGFESQGWFAVMAPAATPAPVVERLNAEVNKALAQPDFRDRLLKVGAEPAGGSTEQLRQLMQAETLRWGKVIKDAGVKAE